MRARTSVCVSMRACISLLTAFSSLRSPPLTCSLPHPLPSWARIILSAWVCHCTQAWRVCKAATVRVELSTWRPPYASIVRSKPPGTCHVACCMPGAPRCVLDTASRVACRMSRATLHRMARCMSCGALRVVSGAAWVRVERAVNDRLATGARRHDAEHDRGDQPGVPGDSIGC